MSKLVFAPDMKLKHMKKVKSCLVKGATLVSACFRKMAHNDFVHRSSDVDIEFTYRYKNQMFRAVVGSKGFNVA